MASVLVVDDEPDARAVLQMLLSLQGYAVTTAADGAAALLAVNECKPDVIVTDWMMPQMNGQQLCRRLREDPATRAIPIIMSSAVSADLDRNSPRNYDRYLRKPVDFEVLLSTIRALIDKRS
jgi:CheY-like chemotaxis protein